MVAIAESIQSDPVRLLSTEQVAALYGVTTRAVNLWAQMRKIPKPCVDRKNFRRWRYCDIAEHILNMGKDERAEASR